MLSKLKQAAITACLVLAPAAQAHDDTRYATVADFMASVAGVTPSFNVGAYGDVTGSGRKDWAGVVQFSTLPRGNDAYWEDLKEQLVILAQARDGSYTVASQSRAIATWPNFHFHRVRIYMGSVFFDARSYWHGCGDSETLQVKRYRGQWRLVAARFHVGAGIQYDADGTRGQDAADFDRNLLTGQALARLTPFNQAPQLRHLHIAPETLPLDRLDPGRGQGWSRAFDAFLKGLDTGC